MARINFNELQLQVEKQIGQVKAYRQFALRSAEEIFERAKEELLADFDHDPVTEEIEEGPDKVGSSFLPNGYGNLFSFLGFYADETPIEELRAFLERNIVLIQTPTTKPLEYLFQIQVPNQEEIASVTPMPFGTAQSWVLSIEKGLSGFNRYLFDLERDFSASRSGPAVQTDEKHVLRGGSFGGTPYLFEKLFVEFERNLREQ